jgi:hypothetical protein
MIRYTDIDTGNNYLDEAIENYLMRGFQPGGFLTSVLANDLCMAVGRADHWNQDNLARIVKEVTFKMPSIAWGSYAAVKKWCQDADGRQTRYREQKEKEFTWRSLKGETKVRDYNDPPF